ncbi:MAG: hypothetical protein COA57_08350 [Flavobacteriales bacterium]|nr:MAG: hypothetical protein COA57_08350 [Flavobacteriales bacterium]
MNLAKEKIETTTTFVWIRNDGIICVQVKDNAEVELEDSIQTFEVVKKLAGEGKKPVLVLTGIGGTITPEVREFSSSERASEPTLAEAIVVKSLAHRIIVNFIINFNKPARPIKLFNDEKEAVKWLKEMERKYLKSKAA